MAARYPIQLITLSTLSAMKNNNLIETIAPRLTELMIQRIEHLETDWQKPWITDLDHGLPRNLRGTPYRAGNILLLLFLSGIAGYQTPIFMTFRQAKEEGLNILKNSKSFPVYFWKIYIRHKETHRKIDLKEYRQLPKEVRKQYEVIPIIRYYSVFNLDQTDMHEKQPERYAALTARSEHKNYSDGMVCEPIDRMIEQQSWLCPIELRYGDRAYNTRLHDRVVCPLKEQFPKGEAFYGTLLHEIAHSTGHAERLNRIMGLCFGDRQYAREELVAELTSALCGAMIGFSATPREENAAYLKEWLSELHREPSYLFDILVDVNRAARMIFDHLEPGADEIADEEADAPAA